MVFDNLLLSGEARKVILKDYVTDARIGIYASEYDRKQKVRINIEAYVVKKNTKKAVCIEDVFNYDAIPSCVEVAISEGHCCLQEELVRKIASRLLKFPEILALRVRSEKLEAYPKADSVGIEEIFRKED